MTQRKRSAGVARSRTIHGAGEHFTAFLDAVYCSSPVGGLTHSFYRYPARFSPQFARKAIEVFTKPGDIVLDPFMGGGTTIVEALALGRRCIGSDLNPLSSFLARVKTTPLSRNDVTALQSWASDLVKSISLHSDNSPHEDWKEYQRNLPWWIRKTLEIALDTVKTLATERQRQFARCSLMKTAQWALDCRHSIPNKEEFLLMHQEDFKLMLAGIKTFRSRMHEAFGEQPSAVCHNRRLLVRTASGIDGDGRLPKHWGPPRLVLTSPPYMGVHILYHRWQVRGRRETPAPYWLAECRDGNGAAHYTFGDRKRKDMGTYLGFLKDSFSSVISLLDRESIVIQLVACAHPETQMSAYLETMKDVGLEEVELGEFANPANRIWRTVPNRKWYADTKGKLSASKEVLLIHRKARR
jgi:hypothetical protein